MNTPFKYRLRVRYHECDGQKVVFNARYGEYVDVAALEYCRKVFGSVDPNTGGIDWRLVHQQMSWKAPAFFDDILEVSVSTKDVGNSSFTLDALVHREGDLLVTSQTVYVVFDDASQAKVSIDDTSRAKLHAGAASTIVDCTGASLG